MSKANADQVAQDGDALVGEFLEACREMSTATIRFHTAVAERLGLNPTDHKCAELILKHGPMPAGRLAELSGLTTGAITGVVDRLEAAGMVTRKADPSDRRRVLVCLEENCEARVAPLFAGIANATAELCARYSSNELRLIMQFLRHASALSDEQARKLREAGER